MTSPAIHRTNTSQLVVSAARARTTARPAPESSFGTVLAASADVVLRGVETAAHVVGGPLMSGAVRGGRVSLAASIGGAGAAGAGGAADDGTFDQVRALQEQAQAFNLEYLALQEEVQQQNRQFSTLSNVAKARHDTSKAILQNIR